MDYDDYEFIKKMIKKQFKSGYTYKFILLSVKGFEQDFMGLSYFDDYLIIEQINPANSGINNAIEGFIRARRKPE